MNITGLSNVIQTIDFVEQYKDMVTYEDPEKEFSDLKSAFRTENASASHLAENRGKNRYMNIVANDATRVKLSNQGKDLLQVSVRTAVLIMSL